MKNNNRVLVVVTNGHQLDNGQYAGVWLSEVAEPVAEFISQGYVLDVASPQGGDCKIDPASLHDGDPSQAARIRELLGATLPLAKAKAQDYDAIFLAGGHGAMFDFPHDVQLQNLLTDFSTAGKPIGAVCHGVAGLVGAKLDKGNALVENKRLTGFTNAEEAVTSLQAELPFLLETKLKELEADFIAAPNGEDHIEIDGGLVTGQNPQSSLRAARAVSKLINQHVPQAHNQARLPGGA